MRSSAGQLSAASHAASRSPDSTLIPSELLHIMVGALQDTLVPAVKILQLPRITEPRGSLTFGEYDAHLPFAPLRYFIVYDVPGGDSRGDHAHRRVSQALISVHGTVTVGVDDGMIRDSVVLADPAQAVLIPPRVWATQTFSAGARLLVLCSEPYDAAEYIRDYDEFITLVRMTGDDKTTD